MLKRYSRGQSTLEYAIIIAVIVAALVVMQIYIKRGVQGKLRSSTDQIGEQYSPGHTTGGYTTTTGSTTHEAIVSSYSVTGTANGLTTTGITRGDQTRTGNETVAGQTEENWPK